MKKINFPRITWVTSLFAILIIILFLVVTYKINYEYLSYNYLYFYECDSNLCVSNIEEETSLTYSKYECGYDVCPDYVKNINEDYVVLNKDKEYILYNYKTAKIISSKYEDYEFINSNYIIVTSNKKKGIITLENKLIVDTIYDDIGIKNNEYLEGYNLNNIIVKLDGLYGIISFKNGNIIEDLKYKEEELNTLIELIKSQE